MAYTIPQLNLILQVIIAVVLFVSLAFKQKGKFIAHGGTMLVAVILNAFSFFWIMGPSFLGLGSFVSEQPSNILSLATILHGILGAVAEILGIYIVVVWGLRKSTQQCIRKRTAMRITLILWLVALFSGFLLYAILYGIITI